MPDNVSVGKVHHDEIRPAQLPVHLVYHLSQTEFRHLLKRHSFGRRDHNVLLSGIRSPVSAVKEECYMGEFFRFGGVELGAAGFNFPLAPAAAEDHRISVLYAAYGGACFIHTHKGLHVVIAFASGIGGPDCLGQLNAAPALLFHHSRILLTKW